MADTVFNPKHYMQGSHECINEIKAMLSPEEFKGFLKGNVIKYRYRANLKNGKEDLAKADNYAYYLIHGCFKKVDSNDSNNPADTHNDVSKRLIDDDAIAPFLASSSFKSSNPFRSPEDKELVSFLKQNGFNIKELNKLIENLDKHLIKWIDNYKGEKIVNDKDYLSFNLFYNLCKFAPIANVAYVMYKSHDLNKDTPVTFKIINNHVDKTRYEIKFLDGDVNQHIFTFKDGTKLSVKVDRGITSDTVLSSRCVTRWYEVKIEER